MSGPLTLKRRIKGAFSSAGLPKVLRRFVPPAVAILKYHSVQDDPQQFAHSIGAGIIHSAAVFREQMELVASKFDPVSLDDVLQFVRGKQQLPRRPVVVTFDDGYRDNFEIAAPILDHFGVPAAFYVTVNSIDTACPPWFCHLRHIFGTTKAKTWNDSQFDVVHDLTDPQSKKFAFLSASKQCACFTGKAQNEFLARLHRELDVEPLDPNLRLMMTWDQVRALAARHIVGSHTFTHPNMAQVTLPEVRHECEQSKKRLAEELQSEVAHFSYPSPILQPHWSNHTREATRDFGFKTAVTSDAGPVNASSDPLALRRVAVPNEKEEFLWSLECTLLGRKM